MMERLTRRGETLAIAQRRRHAQRLAVRMKEMLADASVEVVDAHIVVSGRGILKRWLIDPGLRFLWSGLK